jgi:hypothetical protein
MKYLLMLFGLSSVLASQTGTFLNRLYNIQTDLIRSGNYSGWAPTCLRKFIKDYTFRGYEHAWENFNKIDANGYSCFNMTKFNQGLGKKIEDAAEGKRPKLQSE